MSDQRNEATYRAVCGRSPFTEPKPAPTTLDFTGSVNLLYARVKSQPALSAMLGVPRRTLRRWLAGEVPGRTALDRQRRDLVEGAARRLIATQDNAAVVAVRRGRLSLTRETSIRNKRNVHIIAVNRYDATRRHLKFTIGGDASTGLHEGTIDAAVDAYLNGATALDGGVHQNVGVFVPIVYGMTDSWYREAFLNDELDGLAFNVEKVTFS